ncbi:hypothetical protein HPB48_006839 [Haemaphysalis longicornis]|uniref:Uncharacterized protein n=1 Tax=Haemaphysalis longicornis TaxID=44386 RepID=A0A9J6FEC8_HAELO|nr:hypothetical protein HPB48_006839 [Haemaphysalis longicornis]
MPSLPPEYLTAWFDITASSGHGRAAAMQPPHNPFSFLVQVSRYSYCQCKKSNNAFLLLFPCPSVIFTMTCECLYLVKTCGDVELNPGPDDVTNNLSGELSNVVKAITAHVDSRHDELMKILDEVKLSRRSTRAHGVQHQHKASCC